MAKSQRLMTVFALAFCAMLSATTFAASSQTDKQGDAARLKPAYRFERNHWIYVHLEGTPADIGYQHGYLLAPEIADGFKTVKFLDTRRTKRDWEFFRNVAKTILWPTFTTQRRDSGSGRSRGGRRVRASRGLTG